MSDNVKDNDPDADDQLMREPRKSRLPFVHSMPCDNAVVAGAMGVLRAVAHHMPRLVNERGQMIEWEIQGGLVTRLPNNPGEVAAAFHLPGQIVKTYERGAGQPPRAIKVRCEVNGREIFMVWTSVVVKGARQFQWSSRGYTTRTGGMPIGVPWEACTLWINVLRWAFVVGDPFKDEGGVNE